MSKTLNQNVNMIENEMDLRDEDFVLVQSDMDIKDEKIQGKPIGFFKDAMLRFLRNKAATAAFIIIAFIAIMAVIGPSLNKFTYREQHIEWASLPPKIQGLEKLGIFDGIKEKDVPTNTIEKKYKESYVETVKEFEKQIGRKTYKYSTIKYDAYKEKGAEGVYFWFGSDTIGRDLFTRLWRGTRISLLIGFLAAITNMIIGVIYGSISGYYGGLTDMLMQRFIEILGGIPLLVVIILFIMYYGTGIIPIAIALVLTGWIGTSKMIRAQFYKYKRMEYVLASRTMGAADPTLIFRHILPNAIGPTITAVTLAIPAGIFTESFLAYLGLGIQAPEPSIGVLLAEGQRYLRDMPHFIIFPAITISILMIGFNLLGNGLRDAFDPTLRGQE